MHYILLFQRNLQCVSTCAVVLFTLTSQQAMLFAYSIGLSVHHGASLAVHSSGKYV